MLDMYCVRLTPMAPDCVVFMPVQPASTAKTKAAPGRAWQENPTHEDLRSAIMATGRQAYQTETSAHCAR